ncbi:hypothetical protein E4U41_007367 [Claviceps citrina]|nr:hypothetical protein E4U41_007367 [Claviceps citrina]
MAKTQEQAQDAATAQQPVDDDEPDECFATSLHEPPFLQPPPPNGQAHTYLVRSRKAEFSVRAMLLSRRVVSAAAAARAVPRRRCVASFARFYSVEAAAAAPATSSSSSSSSSPAQTAATTTTTTTTPDAKTATPATKTAATTTTTTTPDAKTAATTETKTTTTPATKTATSVNKTTTPVTKTTTTAAKTTTPVTKTATTAAKTTSTPSTWKYAAKPATAAPAARSASTSTSSNSKPAVPEPPAPYEPTTIAHNRPSDEDAARPHPSAGTDWANSFHGIATRPVTEEQFKVLMAPVDVKDIEVKPDGVIYLPEIKYRRRLNETFGPMGWGMIPKGEAVVGSAIVTREYALIVDGRFVSQAQGENGYFSPDQLPSAVEGCKSNALMRCCKDLGIGSELWDPHFVRWFRKVHMEEVWVEHATTKKKRTFWYRKGHVDVAYPYKLSK